jgi:hypothetical protein
MSAKDDLIASLKQFAYGETAHAGTVANAIEREALTLWDDGVKDGVDLAVHVIELVAAGHPEHTHALHQAVEAIRATHRALVDRVAADDERFEG